MNSGKTGEAGRQLERLWASGTLTGLSDSQLLGRYVDGRGRDTVAEAAFRELVHRHGPMVLAVCRQLLRHRHDADDAFQATFLVLVRKARSIRVDESLAPWLCSVAYRTARRAREIAARYRPMDAVRIEEPAGPSPDDTYHFDLRPLLHEELNRLPDKFRDVIVLCHLEGKSHEEAAQLLRWPIGTVSSRLSRGRRLLRSRLERRGLEVSPAMLSANWLAGHSDRRRFAPARIHGRRRGRFRDGARGVRPGPVPDARSLENHVAQKTQNDLARRPPRRRNHGGPGVGPPSLIRVEAVLPRPRGDTGIRPGGGRRAGPGRRIGPATRNVAFAIGSHRGRRPPHRLPGCMR